MYLIYALLTYVVFYIISLYKYGLNKNYRNIELIGTEDINKYKDKYIYYSTQKGVFELFWIMSLSILIFLYAFHSGLDEEQQMIFMLIGLAIISVAFMRSLFLLNIRIMYDDNFLYIRKGLNESKYRLKDINNIIQLQYHLTFRLSNKRMIYFLPLGMNHSHVIYKMILDKINNADKIEKINNDISI